MSDHQRVHPAQDVEAPAAPPRPEVPLVPRGAIKSDERYPADPRGRIRPPKKRRGRCCRCVCWTILLLLLLVIVIAATCGILYLVFRPKLPKYSVDELMITQFSTTGDNPNRLSATFSVTITATNPNDKIGIYYEGGSRISVWYLATKLTEGSLPKFYQGHRNTTVLAVSLSGQTDDAATLLGALQDQQMREGFVPLTLRVRQPVRVKLGRLKLFKVKFLVRCRLSVDALSTNSNIRIRNSSCKFSLRL